MMVLDADQVLARLRDHPGTWTCEVCEDHTALVYPAPPGCHSNTSAEGTFYTAETLILPLISAFTVIPIAPDDGASSSKTVVFIVKSEP